MLLLAVANAFQVGSNVWIATWSGTQGELSEMNDGQNGSGVVSNGSNGSKTEFGPFQHLDPRRAPGSLGPNQTHFLAIYSLLVLGEISFLPLATYLMWRCFLRAARLTHAQMLSALARAPMSYFDATPLGRIANRFSTDIKNFDLVLPDDFALAILPFFRLATSAVILLIFTPFLVLAFVPIFAVFWYFQSRYLPVSLQLQRIMVQSVSPLLSHVTSMIEGATVILCFRVVDSFFEDFWTQVDRAFHASWYAVSGNQVLFIPSDSLGLVFIFVYVLMMLSNLERFEAATVGLTTAYALNIIANLGQFIFHLTKAQTSFVSAERCFEMLGLPREAAEGRKPEEA